MKNRIYSLSVLVIFSIVLISCSSSKETVRKGPLVIYPDPPEQPRVQFLTTFSKSTDITGEESEFLSSVVGKEEIQSLNKPYGIAIRNGKIYICDTMLGGLVIVDLENSTYENFIPQGMGVLKKPINCFIDDKNKLYVTDTERNQVVVFDENLEYLTSFGDKEDVKPIDIIVDDKNIWVADMRNHAVMVYNRNNFEYERSIPGANPDSSAQLFSPTNLAMKDNHLYVSDFGAFRVNVYTKNGDYIRTVGSYGRGLGQFVRQKGIAVDNDENLYVIDAGFENAQIFDNEGNLLMFFGGPYNGPGDMWLPAKIVIDYDNLEYFQKYVHEDFKLKYIILVTNQYGPDRVNIYGFIEPKG